MLPTNERRIWICPISTARFEADSEEVEEEGKQVMKRDMWGNLKPEENWSVKPLDDLE